MEQHLNCFLPVDTGHMVNLLMYRIYRVYSFYFIASASWGRILLIGLK